MSEYLFSNGNLVSSVNPLPVAATVATSTIRVASVPTVTASTYAAGKVIGGIMSFANILPAVSYAGILQSITIKFKGSVQTTGLSLAVFDASPSGTFSDGSTAAISVADSTNLMGVYRLTAPLSTLGTHTVYNLDGIGKALQGLSTSLYAVVIPDSTTAALGSTSDLAVILAVLQG